MRKLLTAVLVAGFLAGCTTQPTQQAPVEERAPSSVPQAGGSGAATSGVPGSGVTGAPTSPGAGVPGAGAPGGALRDPNNILSKRSVYFEFDSFTVSDQYKPLIEAHARYLVTNRNARMTMQGNTDERGSREYNIALGQKRADAVRRMLTLLGAQDAQIETVSLGKEKPKNAGHDEAAWAENRRADMVYAGE